MTSQPLTISRLAASADVHVETVRYYQRRGLLREPAKPLGGIRRYDHEDVARLRFIRRAQAVGFTLGEIADLLKIRGKRACDQTRQLTEEKLGHVRRSLDELRRLEGELVQLLAECDLSPSPESCPTLDRLERVEAGRHD